MIGLQEAAWIATVLGTGANIIDRIYDRFFLVKTGSPPPEWAHPNQSACIQNKRDESAIVLTKNGSELHRVTYDDLTRRLNNDDIEYIKTRETAMRLLYEQWKGAYPTLATEVDPVRKVQIQQVLEQKTDDLGKELRAILDFLERRCRLTLDDHYNAFRDLAGQ